MEYVVKEVRFFLGSIPDAVAVCKYVMYRTVNGTWEYTGTGTRVPGSFGAGIGVVSQTRSTRACR